MIVHEIFSSIAGEINHFHQGILTTFIRTQGCNLRCSFCDTKETQTIPEDAHTSIDVIMRQVRKLKNNVVCITGGEPLLQDDIYELADWLQSEQYKVVLETNGSIPIKKRFLFDCIVLDYKFEYADRMLSNNKLQLRSCDVLKFVFKDKKELIRAIVMQQEHQERFRTGNIFAYSPVITENSKHNYSEYVDILLQYFLPNAVFSLQLHKFIGVK